MLKFFKHRTGNVSRIYRNSYLYQQGRVFDCDDLGSTAGIVDVSTSDYEELDAADFLRETRGQPIADSALELLAAERGCRCFYREDTTCRWIVGGGLRLHFSEKHGPFPMYRGGLYRADKEVATPTDLPTILASEPGKKHREAIEKFILSLPVVSHANNVECFASRDKNQWFSRLIIDGVIWVIYDLPHSRGVVMQGSKEDRFSDPCTIGDVRTNANFNRCTTSELLAEYANRPDIIAKICELTGETNPNVECWKPRDMDWIGGVRVNGVWYDINSKTNSIDQRDATWAKDHRPHSGQSPCSVSELLAAYTTYPEIVSKICELTGETKPNVECWKRKTNAVVSSFRVGEQWYDVSTQRPAKIGKSSERPDVDHQTPCSLQELLAEYADHPEIVARIRELTGETKPVVECWKRISEGHVSRFRVGNEWYTINKAGRGPFIEHRNDAWGTRPLEVPCSLPELLAEYADHPEIVKRICELTGEPVPEPAKERTFGDVVRACVPGYIFTNCETHSLDWWKAAEWEKAWGEASEKERRWLAGVLCVDCDKLAIARRLGLVEDAKEAVKPRVRCFVSKHSTACRVLILNGTEADSDVPRGWWFNPTHPPAPLQVNSGTCLEVKRHWTEISEHELRNKYAGMPIIPKLDELLKATGEWVEPEPDRGDYVIVRKPHVLRFMTNHTRSNAEIALQDEATKNPGIAVSLYPLGPAIKTLRSVTTLKIEEVPHA